MYGYKDYNGPKNKKSEYNSTVCHDDDDDDPSKDDKDDNKEEEEDDDPLRVARWMEGDSLSPPCGSSIPLLHTMFTFASLSANDVLYDLGCGDGRVCLEAYVQCGCRVCVGVEIEEELVERFQELICGCLEEVHRAAANEVVDYKKEEEEQEGECEEEEEERCIKGLKSFEEGGRNTYEKDEELIVAIPNIRVIHGDLVEVLQSLLDDTNRDTAENNNNNNNNNNKCFSCTENSDNKSCKQKQKQPQPQQPFGVLPIPTVICLYLLPEALELIKPYLVDLMDCYKSNLRIVCNTWGLKGLTPVKTMDVKIDGEMTITTLSMYTYESLA